MLSLNSKYTYIEGGFKSAKKIAAIFIVYGYTQYHTHFLNINNYPSFLNKKSKLIPT